MKKNCKDIFRLVRYAVVLTSSCNITLQVVSVQILFLSPNQGLKLWSPRSFLSYRSQTVTKSDSPDQLVGQPIKQFTSELNSTPCNILEPFQPSHHHHPEIVNIRNRLIAAQTPNNSTPGHCQLSANPHASNLKIYLQHFHSPWCLNLRKCTESVPRDDFITASKP